MITGDNRCLVLSPTDHLRRNDDRRTTTTTGGNDGSRLHFGEPVQLARTKLAASGGNRDRTIGTCSLLPNNKTIHRQLNTSTANDELLKLTDLKLHDDDDDNDNQASETTTSTSQAQATKYPEPETTPTTIEAPATLNESGQSGMLVASCSEQSPPPPPQSMAAATSGSGGGGAAAAASEAHQRQLVELDTLDYATDYPMMHQYQSEHSQHHQQLPHAASHSHSFAHGSAGSLAGYHPPELELANYPAYGSHSDYLISQQPQALEFLELEPSGSSTDSRVLLLQGISSSKILYHHNHHPQQPSQAQRQHHLGNFDGSGASSAQNQLQHQYEMASSQSNATGYLSLDPSPAACNLTYDSGDLPDSVIQFNHHHQNHQQQQRQFSSSIIRGSQTIQFASCGAQNQYYNNDNQQRQDSCSSLSCVDGSGSLAGLSHGDGPQQQQQQHQSRLQPMVTMMASADHHQRHHHQQHQMPTNQPYSNIMITGGQTGCQQTEPELKVCEWEGCENTFMDMQEFVRHLEDRHVNQKPNEKNRYFCLWSNCKRNEQEFNARYKLLIHMRVHSGEKPYPCNNMDCKKSFSRLENLKIHQRSHTGEKPYKCIFDACSKSFTNSSDRIKHHKTHKDPKPYSCNHDGCSKRYTDPSSLRKHLRAHKRSQVLRPAGSEPANCCLDQLQSSGSGGSNSELGLACCSASYDPASLLSLAETTQAISHHHHHHHQHEQRQHLYPPTESGGHRKNLTVASQMPSQQPSSYNLQQQQQHNQLSRSWCAGTTTSNLGYHDDYDTGGHNLISSSPWNHHEPPGQPVGSGDPSRPVAGSNFNFGQQQQPSQYQDHQQHHHQHQHQRHQQRRFPAAVQQLRAQHETLMRSLPLAGGFRVPFSRLSHAHAEWPPPTSSSEPQPMAAAAAAAAAGGPSQTGQFGQQYQHQSQQQQQQHQP